MSEVGSETRRPVAVRQVDEPEDLPDLPLTPREGWTSLVALVVMLVVVGMAIDDALWAGPILETRQSQTGFLPICGLFSVLLGAVLAKSELDRKSVV